MLRYAARYVCYVLQTVRMHVRNVRSNVCTYGRAFARGLCCVRTMTLCLGLYVNVMFSHVVVCRDMFYVILYGVCVTPLILLCQMCMPCMLCTLCLFCMLLIECIDCMGWMKCLECLHYV